MVSYVTLRKLIGVIAISLPVVLALGGLLCNCKQLLVSISNYYHTPMRNIFVGALFAVSFFMFSYKGRQTKIWWLRENLFSNVGGVLAMLTAIIPTANRCKAHCNVPISFPEKYQLLYGVIHNIVAVLFFGILIYFCLVLFKEKDEVKYCGSNLINVKRRNLIFKLCGYVMLFCILITVIFYCVSWVLKLNCEFKQLYNLVFWAELIALWAFGFSWLVKSQVCWKDTF